MKFKKIDLNKKAQDAWDWALKRLNGEKMAKRQKGLSIGVKLAFDAGYINVGTRNLLQLSVHSAKNEKDLDAIDRKLSLLIADALEEL